MMNRRILTLLLTIFILTGLAFSAVPYLSSFKLKQISSDQDNLSKTEPSPGNIQDIKGGDVRQ